MIIKQLSVFVENKTGRLAEITDLLAKHQIHIRALSIADTTDYGILRLIVNKPDEAEKAMRDEGMTVSLTGVIAVAIPDRPGGLASAVRVLSDERITIEYMYAFLTPKDDMAFVIMRVEDNDKAVKVLQEHGISLISESEIYAL